MTRHSRRAFLGATVAGALGACSTTPPLAPELPAGSDREAAWASHRAQLDALRGWTASARLGLRAKGESWTASLNWKQIQEVYRVRLSGPLGQGIMEVNGDPHGVELRMGSDQRFTAKEPEQLLREQVGWQVPLSGLRHWIIGRPQPDTPVGAMNLDESGRLSRLEQSGWRIFYDRYTAVNGLALPSKVTLENPRLFARIVVNRWNFEA